MYADIIIKNGRCVTMCGDGGADWVAAAGKMICAAGRGDDWQKLVRPGTQVIDARGGTVLPGFIDNHFHVMQTAVNMMSVDLGGARSHRELGEMLAAAEKREGAVLGCQVEESQFEEKRFPDRYVLDKYCSDSPVVLFSKEYHVSMLNTHALLYYKVPFSLEGVELDSSGLPTGIFRRNANYVLRSNVLRSLPDEFRMEAIHLAMSRLLENGITTVAAIEGGWLFDDRDAEFIYAHSGEFPVDMPLFYQTMDLAKVWKLGLRRVGERYLRSNNFAAMFAAGAVVCGGSDSDVTEPRPMLGIHAAVNRAVPQCAVSVEQAIEMYTVNGAYALFEDKRKGKLAPGYLADIVVLDRDIRAVPAEQLEQTDVTVTIKSGSVLHSRQ